MKLILAFKIKYDEYKNNNLINKMKGMNNYYSLNNCFSNIYLIKKNKI